MPKKAKATELSNNADQQVQQFIRVQRQAPNADQQVQRFIRVQRQAPLPTPQEFKGYEEVVKGAAERIICMAEERQKHIIDIDQKKQTDSNSHSARGQYMAFILAFAGIAGAFFLAWDSGAALWGAAVVGVIGVSVMVTQFLKK